MLKQVNIKTTGAKVRFLSKDYESAFDTEGHRSRESALFKEGFCWSQGNIFDYIES